MHIDARELENDSLIEGDICIIGAGAAGISMALEWINTPYKVLLLEGGGFEYDQKVQESYNGKTTGQKYFPLMTSRIQQFGGTTSLWGGFCSTLDDIDFKQRDWVPFSGWPFEKKELDPYYKRCQKYLELPTSEYDLDYYLKGNPDIHPIPFNDENVWNKIWQFSPPTRFGSKYKDEIINSKNIHLYTYAKATNLAGNDNVNNIQEITINNHVGKSHNVKAKYFILACGAIQNSRMLLSSNNQVPDGLGNQNDTVGRYFMEHLEMMNSAELWTNQMLPMDLYTLNASKFRAELALSEKVQKENRILNGTSNLRPFLDAKFTPSRMETWEIDEKGNPLPSSNFIEKVKTKILKINDSRIHNINNAYLMGTRIEQSPNPNSRVTIGHEVDSLGVPLANLHWELSPIDKYSIRKMYEIIGKEIGRLDLGRVKLSDWLHDSRDFSWPESTSGGWHHMGTTRMNNDPKLGVVDINCQVHGINNLFIAGSSCFPTAGSVNPTLTLIALTIRLSDFLTLKIKNTYKHS